MQAGIQVEQPLIEQIYDFLVQELAPDFVDAVALLQLLGELVRGHLVLLREGVEARVHFLGLDAYAFLGGNFLEDEAGLHALAGRVVRGLVNLILLRVDHLLGHAALLVLLHDLINDVARLLRHERLRQLRLDLVEQALDDLAAHGAGLLGVQLVLQVAAHAFAQSLDIVRPVRLRKRVVERGHHLLLHFDEFDFVAALLAGQLRGHEVGGEIDIHRALVAGLGPDELQAETS